MEHLAGVEPALLLLEEAGATPAPELINHIFRAMHSIKGGFGFFGLKNIQELSHGLESVLMRVREGELAISSAVTDALLNGVDKLRGLMAEVEASENVSIAEELQPLLALLVKNGPPPARILPESPTPGVAPPAFDLGPAEREQIATFVRPGMYLYCLTIRGREDLLDQHRSASTFLETLRELGDIILEPADFAARIEGGQEVSLLLATVIELEILAEILHLADSQINPFDPQAQTPCPPSSPPATPSFTPPGPPLPAPPPPKPADRFQPPSAGKKILPRAAEEKATKPCGSRSNS